MNLKDYNLCKTLLQYDILKHRKDYLKEMYINEIESFFNHAIHRVNFQFSLIPQKINPILTFTVFEEIPPRLMYKFCEEFDFYSPTVKYLELSSINDVREYKFVKKIMAADLGVDVDKLLKEFEILSSEEDSTKHENWHYQVYAAKERYEKDIKRYEGKIREFFEGHADMIEFDVDQDVVKVRGKYEHPIPPRLIMDFCDKFGYYMPTLNQDWINTSIFTHVHYRFSKKDCRISKEV